MFVDGQFQGFGDSPLSSALMGAGFDAEYQNVLPQPSSPLQFEMPAGQSSAEQMQESAATGKGAGQLFKFLGDVGAFGGEGDPVVDAPSQVGYQESASPTFGGGLSMGGGAALIPVGLAVNDKVVGQDLNNPTKPKSLLSNFAFGQAKDALIGSPTGTSHGLLGKMPLVGHLNGGDGAGFFSIMGSGFGGLG